MKATVRKTGPYAMRAKKEDHDLTWLWKYQQSVYQADEERSIPDRKRHVRSGQRHVFGWQEVQVQLGSKVC